jgi:hypothetical protein
MEEILQLLRTNLRAVQARQETHTNSNRITYPVYKARDKIWLDARNIISARPIKKLDAKYYGPFEVDKVLDSYSYKLKLLHELEKIYNTFHPSLLRPTNQLPLPGQVNLLPPPITIDENR